MPTTSYKTFGRQFDTDALIGIMAHRNVSTLDLYHALGCTTHQHVKKWVAGLSVPSFHYARKICQELKCSLDEIAPKLAQSAHAPEFLSVNRIFFPTP